MPEAPTPDVEIDAAVERVVKASGDRDALTEAVRVLARLLGYGLVVKTAEPLAVGDRVRLLRDLPETKADTLGEVVGLLIEGVDVQFDGQPYPMLYGREDVEPSPAQDDPGEHETGAEPQPRDGERATCVFGCAIRYIEQDGIGWWAHDEEPADRHDAELGGPA
jgi:hypothetical protein